MSFNTIQLRTNEYLSSDGVRRVDQIELHGFDIQFTADITSERHIRLANRMAEELGIEIFDYRKSAVDA